MSEQPQQPESDRYLSDASSTQAWRDMVQRDMAEQRMKIDGVVKRVDEQAEQIDSIRGELFENSKMTKKVKDDTSHIVEFTNNAAGFMKVCDQIAKIAKPLTALLLFGTAIAAGWESIVKFFK